MTIKEQARCCSLLSDEELWAATARLASQERAGLRCFLLHLMEVKRRDLHIRRAYPGLFTYLVKLGFSQWEAHARSAAVEAAEKHRSVLALLGSGRLTLSAIVIIAPFLKSKDYRLLLRKACRRSARQVQALVAGLSPQPQRRDVIRVLSAPSPLPAPRTEACSPPGSPALAAAQPEPGAPTAPGPALFGVPAQAPPAPPQVEVYSITFAADKETHDLLMRAQELLRHRFPKAGIGEIVNFALKKVLAEIDRDLRRTVKRARPATQEGLRSRQFTEAAKQESWERDGGQCAFVAPDGTRCTARAWLQFDHELPFALGGSSRDSRNARPYCFRHNQWAAKQAFGDRRRTD